jgi:hypothetical protein
MNDRRQMIPIAGLAATIAVTIYMVAQLQARQAPGPAQQQAAVSDFTDAATAEVQDAQGQTILRGLFSVSPEDDDDVERKAALESTGIDTDAIGEAEVEFAMTNPVEQEVEFTIRNVAPGAVLTVLIDGQAVGQVTADRRGRAELDRDIPMPGASASR